MICALPLVFKDTFAMVRCGLFFVFCFNVYTTKNYTHANIFFICKHKKKKKKIFLELPNRKKILYKLNYPSTRNCIDKFCNSMYSLDIKRAHLYSSPFAGFGR